jgi:hypothetical protein
MKSTDIKITHNFVSVQVLFPVPSVHLKDIICHSLVDTIKISKRKLAVMITVIIIIIIIIMMIIITFG